MADVRQVVEQINQSWRSGQLDHLGDFFDSDMIIVGPGYQELARGREACIASYREFLRASTVRAYRESGLTVREWGGVAVATYEWEMDFEQGGRLHREAGTDLFVFERRGEDWLAVWRAVTFSPREA
jgi:ketosteroid isomerase-like protein